jgi:hypothetical protein
MNALFLARRGVEGPLQGPDPTVVSPAAIWEKRPVGRGSSGQFRDCILYPGFLPPTEPLHGKPTFDARRPHGPSSRIFGFVGTQKRMHLSMTGKLGPISVNGGW